MRHSVGKTSRTREPVDPARRRGASLVPPAYGLNAADRHRGRSVAMLPAAPGPGPGVIQRIPDKAYGLSNERASFITKRRKEGYDINTVDELNNQFLGTDAFTKQDAVPYPAESSPPTQEAALFKTFLEAHPQYDPRDVTTADKTWMRVKRACKAGIEFTAKQNQKIYFVLDGINLKSVVDKTSPNPANYQDWFDDSMRGNKGLVEKNFLPITAAELRYVYRKRDDPVIRDHVIFWKDDKEVDEPWITDPALWSRYQPKSENIVRIFGLSVISVAVLAFLAWIKANGI